MVSDSSHGGMADCNETLQCTENLHHDPYICHVLSEITVTASVYHAKEQHFNVNYALSLTFCMTLYTFIQKRKQMYIQTMAISMCNVFASASSELMTHEMPGAFKR